jgi:membrane-associated HD superfamily phosphohydrolase
VCCSIQLREAEKESDEVKQLYVEVCSSKEKLLATLECEQKAKKDLATLLDIGTEKLRKAQADLETECQKVSAAVAVLDMASPTDSRCSETLIDRQLINIAHFY